MFNLHKAFAACKLDLRRLITDPRFYVTLGLILLFADNLMNGIYSFMVKYDVTISAPGLAGYLLSDVQMSLVIVIAGMILFSNAPFINDAQVFILIRTKRKEWIVGQQFYILMGSFVIALLSAILPLILFADRLDFSNEWGKTITTLASTNIGNSFSMKFQAGLLMKFTPYSLFAVSVLFKWILIDVLAQIIFIINVITKKGLGIMLSLSYALLDISIELILPTSLYKYSLVSLSRMSTLGTGYLEVLPTFEYRAILYACVFVITTLLCYAIANRSNITEAL